jgi:hypothetical protein
LTPTKAVDALTLVEEGVGIKVPVPLITTLLNWLTPLPVPMPVKVIAPEPTLIVKLEVGLELSKPPEIVPNVKELLFVVIASEVLLDSVIVEVVGNKIDPEVALRLTGKGLVKAKPVPVL